MKKLLLLLLCLPLIGLGQILLPTLDEAPRDKEAREEYNDSILLANAISSAYSLLDYTPTTLNQDETNMCAAFSLSTARSISYNYMNNITDSITKEKERFSPFFIYYIKYGKNNNKCKKGLKLLDRLRFMKDYGFAKMKDVEAEEYSTVYYDNNSNDKRLCQCYPDDMSEFYQDLNNAERFVIDDYKVYGKPIKTKKDKEGNDNWILKLTKADIHSMKLEISDGNPLLFGSTIDAKLWSPQKDKDRVYYPKPLKLKRNFLSSLLTKKNAQLCKHKSKKCCLRFSPHAVVIIGYDDFKFGGSFEIMNSWGNDFGDNGVAWIKYKDFKRIKNGTICSLIDNSEPEIIKKEENINTPNFLTSKKQKFIEKYHFVNTSTLKKCHFKKPKKSKSK